jgi:membrane protein
VWVQIFLDASRRFNADHGFLTAAGLSYFSLLSLIPMLLVGVGVLGYFMDAGDAQNWVIQFFRNFMPALSNSPELQERLLRSLQPSINGIMTGPKEFAAIAGLVGFLWSASSVFLNMEVAFNAILDIKKKRGFLRSRLMAFGMILLGGALLIGSIGITSAINIVQGWKIPLPSFLAAESFEPGKLSLIWRIVGFIVPIFFSFTLFASLYHWLPSVGLHPRPSMIGAAFSAIAFEIAKHAYGWYIGHFAHFNKVYGSLGGLVILTLWTLYSYVILILGAEIADSYGDRFPSTTNSAVG